MTFTNTYMIQDNDLRVPYNFIVDIEQKLCSWPRLGCIELPCFESKLGPIGQCFELRFKPRQLRALNLKKSLSCTGFEVCCTFAGKVLECQTSDLNFCVCLYLNIRMPDI